MAFHRLSKDVLLQQLESVRPGLSPPDKPGTLEQSDCFVLQDGEVMTFNDEVFCKSPCLLGDKVRGAVKAEHLLNMLRKYTEEELDAQYKNGSLILRGKRKESGFRMSQNIELPVDLVDPPGEWRPLHEDFIDAIGIVQQCASSDYKEAFERVTIHIHPRWVEAFDGAQVCRWKMKTGMTSPVLVRQTSVRHVTSLGMHEASETDGWLHFRNPQGTMLSCRKFVDTYPDLDPYLDMEGEPVQLPKSLMDALDRAEEFLETGDGAVRLVMVGLEDGMATIVGQGNGGWHRESKVVRYRGPSITFSIAPKMLKEIVEKHEECVVSATKLKASGGRYTYVSVLSRPEEEGRLVVDTDEEEPPLPRGRRRMLETES